MSARITESGPEQSGDSGGVPDEEEGGKGVGDGGEGGENEQTK